LTRSERRLSRRG